MRAIVNEEYGPLEVLRLKEVEKPTPKDNEVLVKIFAASVNFSDKILVRGKPFLVRLMGMGLLKPKNTILGTDIAGQVEAIGRNVKPFQPGDEVFGDIGACGFGAFAEYVSVPENALTLKPANMTFDEAAAVPQAAVVALQGLRKGQIQHGQKVLINGASGGIGTFARASSSPRGPSGTPLRAASCSATSRQTAYTNGPQGSPRRYSASPAGTPTD